MKDITLPFALQHSLCFPVVPATTRAGGGTGGPCVSPSPGTIPVGFSWDAAANTAGGSSRPPPRRAASPWRWARACEGTRGCGAGGEAPGTTRLVFTDWSVLGAARVQDGGGNSFLPFWGSLSRKQRGPGSTPVITGKSNYCVLVGCYFTAQPNLVPLFRSVSSS